MAGPRSVYPNVPSPSPDHRRHLIFKGHHENEPPDSTETTPTAALTRAYLSQEGHDATDTELSHIPPCHRHMVMVTKHSCTRGAGGALRVDWVSMQRR